MLAEKRIKKIKLKMFFCENLKIKKYIYFKTRMWSDRLPFENLFVGIGWEFFEIFDFGYLLVSDCTKMFFSQKKMKFFVGTSKRFTDPKSMQQDL